jgi:hypothetical protein
MILSRLRASGSRAVRLSLLTFGVLACCAVSTPAQAQTPATAFACVHKGTFEFRVVEPGESCRPNETRVAWPVVQGPAGPQGEPGPQGEQGVQGPVGPAGPGSNATSEGHPGIVPIAPTCTNFSSQPIVVPPAVPGVVVATAKIMVRINHTQGIAGGDRGFITFGTSPTDCNSDPYRSYFRLPVAALSANSYNPVTGTGEYYEFTIPVEVPFHQPFMTDVYYLNGQMLNGVPTVNGVATPNDYMADATITLEFHTTP